MNGDINESDAYTKNKRIKVLMNAKTAELVFLKRQLKRLQNSNEQLIESLRQKDAAISELQEQSKSIENKYNCTIEELKQKSDKVYLKNTQVVLEKNIEIVKDLSKNYLDRGSKLGMAIENHDTIMVRQDDETKEISGEMKIVNEHVANLNFAFYDLYTKFSVIKSNIQISHNTQEEMLIELNLLESTRNKSKVEFTNLRSARELELKRLFQKKNKLEAEYTKKVEYLKTDEKLLGIQQASLKNKLKQKETECIQLSQLCKDIKYK